MNLYLFLYSLIQQVGTDYILGSSYYVKYYRQKRPCPQAAYNLVRKVINNNIISDIDKWDRERSKYMEVQSVRF